MIFLITSVATKELHNNKVQLMIKYIAIISALCFGVACSKPDDITTPVDPINPNIVLILADDLGKDALEGYQEGSIKPNTPNLDNLRNNGLLFNNFWVNPTCSPTRSAIITGKYGYRTGVKGVGDVLNSSETVLQKYISENVPDTYTTAVIGKWHLSGNNANFNPEIFGIDYYAGVIRGAVDNYFNWQLSEDGSSSLQTTYITEKFTDLAIDWVSSQDKPWFLWLAYTAPHTPFHAPPANMHSQGSLPDFVNGMDPIPYYMAAIEAMDFQLGRLLENIPVEEKDKTVIIFMGDNGTPNQVAQAPYTSSTVKNTLYQGGINVPLFVSGHGVSRRGTDNNILVGTDLFATIAQLAGVNSIEYQDSKSFLSLLSESSVIRNFQYAEQKDNSAESWAISNGTYKLLIKNAGNEEFYNLQDDPYEVNNLLNRTLTTSEENAKVNLENELDVIRN